MPTETSSEFDPICRLPAILAATGLPRSSLYAAVRQGVFPKPIKLGARSIGWRRSAVEAFIADPIYRFPEVMHATGLPRSSLYTAIRQGVFPKPVKLSARSIGWHRSTVEAFIAAKQAASRG